MNKRIRHSSLKLALSALLVLLTTGAAVAQSNLIPATVLYVYDGDTLLVRTPTCNECRVRLLQIDAPEIAHAPGERHQAYGPQARTMLTRLVDGEGGRINLVVEGTDQYGRLLASVYAHDDQTGHRFRVNFRMVAIGAAYVYDDYAYSNRLFDLEQHARNTNQGLWAIPRSKRMPPWQWRHTNQAEKQASASSTERPTLAERTNALMDRVGDIPGSETAANTFNDMMDVANGLAGELADDIWD